MTQCFSHRVYSSLKTLFWALFGIIELDDFDAIDQDWETVIGLILVALWLVLSVIALLNLLIALISNSFQKVQV